MPETHGPSWRLHHGDCLDVMKRMDAGSVDAVVTDPPYGLGFMGKAWDHGVPGVPFWAEALRVAKPGAHLLAFGGTRTFHRLTCAIEDAGFEIRDCLSWLYGSGFPKSHNLDGAHEGWGTALKPAWEPVILARKPLIGTVAANVALHGVGALHIDATRIGVEEITTLSTPGVNKFPSAYAGDMIAKRGDSTHVGRWPANVALDESAAAMLDEQSGVGESGVAYEPTGERPMSVAGTPAEYLGRTIGHGDFGGASRFFYTAKASRSEREAGLSRSPLGGGIRSNAPRESESEKNPLRANTHPTVKPVDLMRWLVRLVAPIGATILDPFTGSGTTGVACIEEGVHFVGIEKEAAYVEIARKRLTHAQGLGRLDFAETQR